MGDYNISPKYHVNDVRFLYEAYGRITIHSGDIGNAVQLPIPLYSWMHPNQLNTAISTAQCSSVSTDLLSLGFSTPTGSEPGKPTGGQPYVVLYYVWQPGSTPGDTFVDLNLWFTDPWVLPTLNTMILDAM